MSNAEYHAERERLSSSNLKLLLKDPAQFYQEKILGNKPEQVDNPAFAEGSLLHAMILEPQVIPEEFAIFPGMTKRGPEWEQFKLDNPDKTLLSKPQEMRCQYYYEAFKKRPEAQELMKTGYPELTLCASLLDVPVKVRTDFINPEAGIIVDVKTSGFPVDLDSFRLTVQQWQYGLSAALYCEVAKVVYGREFDFYFIAISKKDGVCEVFKLSDINKQLGLLEVYKALNIYKECKAKNMWTKFEKKTIIESDYEILEI